MSAAFTCPCVLKIPKWQGGATPKVQSGVFPQENRGALTGSDAGKLFRPPPGVDLFELMLWYRGECSRIARGSRRAPRPLHDGDDGEDDVRPLRLRSSLTDRKKSLLRAPTSCMMGTDVCKSFAVCSIASVLFGLSVAAAASRVKNGSSALKSN